MELRHIIDDRLVERVQERTDVSSSAELTREAWRLLDWATAQAEAGRQIGSFDQSGNHPCAWDSHSLSQARGNRDA